VVELDRGDFLRLGASGLLAVAAAGLTSDTANAQLPAPTPQNDDVSYLSFATVAERASRDLHRAAFKQAGTGLSPFQRRHVNRVASGKRAHILRLDGALGADAPLTADFVTILPKGAVASKARIAALGEQLETLLVRVYLNGVGFAADPATRLLLGRLMGYDYQQLAWLRRLAKKDSPAGLLSPIDLEAAADELDAFLSTPDFPD
jgi:ribosomal protein S12 methylthiotransferase accessory factor YcaO